MAKLWFLIQIELSISLYLPFVPWTWSASQSREVGEALEVFSLDFSFKQKLSKKHHS